MNYDKLTKEQLLGIHKDTLEYLEEQEKEIERLTAESTEWESKFYDEAKKVDKAIKYIEQQKPLSIDETRQKEQVKIFYINSDIFKTICHLEDLEIAIWELKDILKGVDKE